MDKEKLKNIIEHYGLKHQVRKFAEESYELIEAIHNYKKSDNPKEIINIEEEIADVLCVVGQFIEYFNIDKYDIDSVINFKTDRTLNRMKNEQLN